MEPAPTSPIPPFAVLATFFSSFSPWNIARPLDTYTQTSDRAEMRPIVWALALANEPVHIKSDNEYVVNGAQTIIDRIPTQGNIVP